MDAYTKEKEGKRMSRPKKRAPIEKQVQVIIAQAVEEGRHDLAKRLIDLLRQEPPKETAKEG